MRSEVVNTNNSEAGFTGCKFKSMGLGENAKKKTRKLRPSIGNNKPAKVPGSQNDGIIEQSIPIKKGAKCSLPSTEY